MGRTMRRATDAARWIGSRRRGRAGAAGRRRRGLPAQAPASVAAMGGEAVSAIAERLERIAGQLTAEHGRLAGAIERLEERLEAPSAGVAQGDDRAGGSLDGAARSLEEAAARLGPAADEAGEAAVAVGHEAALRVRPAAYEAREAAAALGHESALRVRRAAHEAGEAAAAMANEAATRVRPASGRLRPVAARFAPLVPAARRAGGTFVARAAPAVRTSRRLAAASAQAARDRGPDVLRATRIVAARGAGAAARGAVVAAQGAGAAARGAGDARRRASTAARGVRGARRRASTVELGSRAATMRSRMPGVRSVGAEVRAVPQAPGGLALVGALALAQGAFAATFRGPRSRFWDRMTLTGVCLGGLALAAHPPLRRTRIGPREAGIGLISAAVLYGTFTVGDRFARQFVPSGEDDIADIYALRALGSRGELTLRLVAVIAPAEELFWRGFVQEALMARFGRWPGAAMAAGAYAGVHVVTGNFTLFGAAGVAGAHWCALYAAGVPLGALIVSHQAWDVWIFLVQPTGPVEVEEDLPG